MQPNPAIETGNSPLQTNSLLRPRRRAIPVAANLFHPPKRIVLKVPWNRDGALGRLEIKNVPPNILRAMPSLRQSGAERRDKKKLVLGEDFNQFYWGHSARFHPTAVPWGQKYKQKGESLIYQGKTITVGEKLKWSDWGFKIDIEEWFNFFLIHCEKHLMDLIEVLEMPNIYKIDRFYNKKTKKLTDPGQKLHKLLTVYFIHMMLNCLTGEEIDSIYKAHTSNEYDSLLDKSLSFTRFSQYIKKLFQLNKLKEHKKLDQACIETLRFSFSKDFEYMSDGKRFYGMFKFFYSICYLDENILLQPVSGYVKGGQYTKSPLKRMKKPLVDEWKKKLRIFIEVLGKSDFKDTLEKCRLITFDEKNKLKKQLEDLYYKDFHGLDPFKEQGRKSLIDTIIGTE